MSTKRERFALFVPRLRGPEQLALLDPDASDDVVGDASRSPAPDPSPLAIVDPSPLPGSDASGEALRDASPLEILDGSCRWCRAPLAAVPVSATGRVRRVDAAHCSVGCRQRAWRARQALARHVERARADGAPKRLAYADPPYPGVAARYYRHEPEFRGEVDPVAEHARLAMYDGWGLSTNARGLALVLPRCAPSVRVCTWVKALGYRARPHGIYCRSEFVLVQPARALAAPVRDWLQAAPPKAYETDLPGRKPKDFVAWLFALLGAAPGDTLDDLYPGSGIVGRMWGEFVREASRSADLNASPCDRPDGTP